MSATRGRGRNYSPARGLSERVLGRLYAGGWAADLWARFPGATAVAVLREEMVIPGLKAPLRLGFASDLHIGPTTPPVILDRAFAALAEAGLDLLVLGGDYVFLEATQATADRLHQLAASVPAKTKVAVMGNHDLWTRHDLLEQALTAAGVSVLINQGLYLPAPHTGVGIVGIDETWTGAPDGAAAFGAVPDAALTLAIGHAPDSLRHVEGRGASLLLCGHTHGGQLALPGHRPILVPGPLSRAYPHGWHTIQDLRLFVSRGLGGVEVPTRSWAPPDVLILDLVPA